MTQSREKIERKRKVEGWSHEGHEFEEIGWGSSWSLIYKTVCGYNSTKRGIKNSKDDKTLYPTQRNVTHLWCLLVVESISY